MAVGMDVTAHDGDPELPDAVLHTADDLLADVAVDDGHDIDHRQRPSAHGCDVVDVDQHGEVSCVVRIGLHEGFHDPVGSEEDVLVADIDRRRILPLRRRYLRELLRGKKVHYPVDRVLAGDAGIVPDCLCDF